MSGVPEFAEVDSPSRDPVVRLRLPPGSRPKASRSSRPTARMTSSLDFLDTYPGIAPYLRGPYPTMYVTQRGRSGNMPVSPPRGFQRLLPAHLAGGPEGTSVAFDSPPPRLRQRHPRVAGDVGMRAWPSTRSSTCGPCSPASRSIRFGVDDMNGGRAAGAGPLYVAARGAGRAAGKSSPHHSERILKEFMVRNTYIYPPGPSLRIISDIFNFTAAICRSSTRSHLRLSHAGSRRDRRSRARLHARDGLEYVRPASRPVSASTGSPHASRFFWAIGMNYFRRCQAARPGATAVGEADETVQPKDARSLRCAPIADFGLVARRAGRLQQCGAPPPSRRWRHSRVKPSPCTPMRSTRPWPCRPTSRRASRATRRSCCSGSGTTRVIDPWGGSFHVERLTHDLAKRAWGHIQEVEELGGMTKGDRASLPSCASRKRRRAPSAHRRRPAGGHRVNMYRPSRSAGQLLKIAMRRCGSCRSKKLARSSANAIRARSRRRSKRSRARPPAATATCSRSPSMTAAPRRPWARYHWRSSRCRTAIERRSRRFPASISGRSHVRRRRSG